MTSHFVLIKRKIISAEEWYQLMALCVCVHKQFAEVLIGTLAFFSEWTTTEQKTENRKRRMLSIIVFNRFIILFKCRWQIKRYCAMCTTTIIIYYFSVKRDNAIACHLSVWRFLFFFIGRRKNLSVYLAWHDTCLTDTKKLSSKWSGTRTTSQIVCLFVLFCSWKRVKM